MSVDADEARRQFSMSQDEVRRRGLKMAALIQDALPEELPVEGHPDWTWISALLLRRMATQLRTLMALMDAGVVLDSYMVTRSLLEHVTLFCWLAITAPDDGRDWLAVEPEENTRWWVAQNYHEEDRERSDQQRELGDIWNTDEDRGIYEEARAWAAPFKRKHRKRGFPGHLARCEEVDRAAAVRAPGSLPNPNGLPRPFVGYYWTLYRIGNASTHPRLTALVQAFARRDAGRRPLRGQPADHQAAMYEMAIYLTAHAVQVANEVLGWPDYDTALKIAGQYAAVHGPPR